MSQAYNTFMDSYFKRLKRPEFANFNPDQSYGANMVHGSEEQNPWANRNQDNAKFGNLGGANNKVVQGPQAIPGGSLDPSLIGKSFTLPPSGPVENQSQNALDSLMGVVTKPMSNYLGKTAANSISNWISPASSSPDAFVDKLGEMGGGYKQIASEILGLPAQSGDAFEGIGKEMSRESTDLLKGAIGGADSAAPSLSFDPTSMGLAAIPAVGKMLGLRGSAADGLSAATGIGSAALQGGMNPLSDLSAVMSLVKLFGGLF